MSDTYRCDYCDEARDDADGYFVFGDTPMTQYYICPSCLLDYINDNHAYGKMLNQKQFTKLIKEEINKW